MTHNRAGDKGEKKSWEKMGLREQLIGAWRLVSYIESPADGSPKRVPMGEKAQGIIMYTPDGYVSAQLMTTATLKRRALEGGSYRIHISLARLSIWLLEMGIFDKTYAHQVGNSQGDHAYLSPEIFEADTPCGHYLGVTDQVKMSATLGFYKVPVVPRGSSRPEWQPRNGESSWNVIALARALAARGGLHHGLLVVRNGKTVKSRKSVIRTLG
jgi:hypothetical protein